MSRFTYVAVNSADFKRLTEGEAEASDIEELERMLIERGLLLVDARPVKKWRIFKHAISMSDSERADFLESVGEMLEAGISIGEALEAMNESEVKQKTASSRLAEKLFDGVTRGEPPDCLTNLTNPLMAQKKEKHSGTANHPSSATYRPDAWRL